MDETKCNFLVYVPRGSEEYHAATEEEAQRISLMLLENGLSARTVPDECSDACDSYCPCWDEENNCRFDQSPN